MKKINPAVQSVSTTRASKVMVKPSESQLTAIRTAVVEELAALFNKRRTWEASPNKDSDTHFYEILSKCYEIEVSVRANDALTRARCRGLDDFAESRGFSLHRQHTILSKVIRCVFGEIKSKKIDTYEQALRLAIHENISPNQLGSFFEDYGGVDGAADAKRAMDIQAELNAEDAAKMVVDRSHITIVDDPKLKAFAEENEIEKPCLFIATPRPDGSFVLNAWVANNDLMTKAYRAHLSSNYSTYTPRDFGINRKNLNYHEISERSRD